MPKGKGEVEAPPEAQPGEVKETLVVEGEPEAKIFSQAEHDAILAEVKAQAKTEKQELHKVMGRKDQIIGDLRNQPVQPRLAPRMGSEVGQLLLDEMRARQTEYGEPNPRIAALEAEIAKERARESMEEQKQQVEAYTKQWQDKIDQKIKDAGFDPKDKMFREVNKEFKLAYRLDGQFQYADELLDEILAEAKTANPKGGEPKEDVFAKRLEEEKRKWMDEHGLLKTETGGPSGAYASDEALIKAAAEGKSVDMERLKAVMNKISKGG